MIPECLEKNILKMKRSQLLANDKMNRKDMWIGI